MTQQYFQLIFDISKNVRRLQLANLINILGTLKIKKSYLLSIRIILNQSILFSPVLVMTWEKMMCHQFFVLYLCFISTIIVEARHHTPPNWGHSNCNRIISRLYMSWWHWNWHRYQFQRLFTKLTVKTLRMRVSSSRTWHWSQLVPTLFTRLGYQYQCQISNMMP